MSELSLEQWLDVAVEATTETANKALACDSVAVAKPNRGPHLAPAGAYVPIISQKERILIGLVASEDGCMSLARSLLCMETDEADPEEQDIADAIQEIVNIVAGVVQRRAANQVGTVELGLPMFVVGKMRRASNEALAFAEMQFDQVSADLVLLRQTPPENTNAIKTAAQR